MDDVLSVDVRSKKFANTEGSYFFLKDDLGSIVDITDSNGTAVQHYSYSVFGRILGIKDGTGNDITGSPLITSHFTYTGREFDSETGLYYYRARYYDSSIGRFLTEDPHPGKRNNPQTFISKYIYAHNSPINATDPTGKFILGGVGELALAGLVIGVVMGGVSAGIRGENILAGMGTGAIVGLSAGLGVGLGVTLLGTGAGFAYVAQLSLVSGFLSGLISGSIFQMVTGDPKSFNQGFASGFWAGMIGGLSYGLGLGVGTSEGGETLIDSPNTNQPPMEEDIGPSPETIKKLRNLF